MDRPVVRLAVLGTATLAFAVPVFGGRPVLIMIASQAVSTVINIREILFAQGA